METYNAMSEEQRATLAPALFILADNDPISDGSLQYEEALLQNGVKSEVKKYAGAIHGFIEENNPEYEKLSSKQPKSPEQEAISREAENCIKGFLTEVLGGSGKT